MAAAHKKRSLHFYPYAAGGYFGQYKMIQKSGKLLKPGRMVNLVFEDGLFGKDMVISQNYFFFNSLKKFSLSERCFSRNCQSKRQAFGYILATSQEILIFY